MCKALGEGLREGTSYSSTLLPFPDPFFSSKSHVVHHRHVASLAVTADDDVIDEAIKVLNGSLTPGIDRYDYSQFEVRAQNLQRNVYFGWPPELSRLAGISCLPDVRQVRRPVPSAVTPAPHDRSTQEAQVRQ